MSVIFLEYESIEQNVLRTTDTILNAMNVLNSGGELYILVVNSLGVLQGVLTDGDIRRAIIRRVDLSSSIVVAMNSNPTVVSKGQRELAKSIISSVPRLVTFIPEVDGAGRLIGVHVDRGKVDPPVALVMAGGEGRRLGDRTRSTPKPLVEVRGRPMIEHVLGRLGDAGISKAYISIHYLADAMEHWATTWTGIVKIELVRESVPLGTAGALRFLPQHLASDVLVINADVATNVDLRGLVAFQRQLGADVTIATVRHDVQLPFGVVKYDPSGRFRGITEKPVQSYDVAAGIYLLGPDVRRLINAQERIDMPELLERSREAGLSIGVFPIHESWRDLGRPVDLEAEEAARRAEARIRK